MGGILGSLIADFLVGTFGPELQDAIAQVVAYAITFLCTPIQFSWGRAFTVYFQGIALFLAFAVIVVNGIKNGIFINGGTEEESIGHYIFRSTWPIMVIAGSPVLFSFVTTAVSVMLGDLSVASSSVNYAGMIGWFLGNSFFGLSGTVANVIMAAVCTYYVFTVVFQCVRRQVQLAVLSIIGPLVSVMSISENNSGDVITLIKEMVGIGIITSLQLALLLTAISLPTSSAMSGIPIPLQPIFVVIMFGSIKHLPRWIERYTLAPTVGGQGGVSRMASMAAGMGIRSGISAAVRSVR